MVNYIQEFDSLNDLYKYLCDTPFNEVFRWSRHSSVENDYSFSHSHSFEEAVDLLRNGWDDMSKKLTQKLNAATKNVQPMKAQKNVLSVQGYQPVVALYLAGVPTNMVSKQMVVKKQKVIEITKSVSYNAGVETETMMAESIKAMMIVKKLEAQGQRRKSTEDLTGERGTTSNRIRSEAEDKGVRATFSYRCITMVTKLEKAGMDVQAIIKIAVMKGLDKDTINTFKPEGHTKYHEALREVQRAA